MLVLLVLTAAIVLGHKSSSSSSDLNLDGAIAEADRLIGLAKQLQTTQNLRAEVFEGSHGVLIQDSSDSSSDSKRHHHGGHHQQSELSTTDQLQQVLEQRIVEKAIEQALVPLHAKTAVVKKAYQARFEISQFDGNDLPNNVVNFGPTVITTRRNVVLRNTQPDDVLPFLTAADYLDANQNGEPDIITALTKFRDNANPTDYIRELRNRATNAVRRGPATRTGSIDLINLIRLDGRFSLTNQLVSNCFSATDAPEFVFEAVVGAIANQTGILTANPSQKTKILLVASTALQEAPGGTFTRRADGNIFFDNGHFVENPPSIGLYLNLFDRFIPGGDVVKQQGYVHFSECRQFNYFQ